MTEDFMEQENIRGIMYTGVDNVLVMLAGMELKLLVMENVPNCHHLQDPENQFVHGKGLTWIA